jgi:uncharacterized protein
MLKWLLVIGVIALIYFLFIKKTPIQKSSQPSNKPDEKLNDDDMVACKACGTYTALGEALMRDGNYFCSQECLKA